MLQSGVGPASDAGCEWLDLLRRLRHAHHHRAAPFLAARAQVARLILLHLARDRVLLIIPLRLCCLHHRSEILFLTAFSNPLLRLLLRAARMVCPCMLQLELSRRCGVRARALLRILLSLVITILAVLARVSAER